VEESERIRGLPAPGSALQAPGSPHPMAKFLMLFILVTLVVLMVLATFKGKK
jgi:hypothetical protein